MMVIASRESADSLESVIQSLLFICSNAAESSFVQFLERVFQYRGIVLRQGVKMIGIPLPTHGSFSGIHIC